MLLWGTCGFQQLMITGFRPHVFTITKTICPTRDIVASGSHD
jgi:hypothetical protein